MILGSAPYGGGGRKEWEDEGRKVRKRRAWEIMDGGVVYPIRKEGDIFTQLSTSCQSASFQQLSTTETVVFLFL